ncbi:hypothetical protein PInf_017094 [Phytophthora infestans]|nr:hypothetical protein PInf_017094 [Phytophthora infestans]
MLVFFCVIVGEADSTFMVKLDEGVSVGKLKKAILDAHPKSSKDVDEREVQLFVAKTSDGKWLEAESEVSEELGITTYAGREKKKLCLIVDEMDRLFQNPDLLTSFLGLLRMWKFQSPSVFLGFLGDFFMEMKPRYPFTASLVVGIMDLSGGVPGVLGSLVRFTADEGKYHLELEAWEKWFSGLLFPMYLKEYNRSYYRILQDLYKLDDTEWWILEQVLEGKDSVKARNPDRLLHMGVVVRIRGTDEVAIVSPMMKRLCLEVLSKQDIREPCDNSQSFN